MKHYALGVVFHPNVTIGHDVAIHHHVTLPAETWVDSPHSVVVEDGAMIGAVDVGVPARAIRHSAQSAPLPPPR